MDWLTVSVFMAVGAFFVWQHFKGAERAKVATARLNADTRLQEHIKTGMRECIFREVEGQFWMAKDGQLLFETAHLLAYKVDHFAESRVGFYFKDLNEYGLYGGFAGNGDEFHESYYRTDRMFHKEEVLVTLDD